ncbi:MAG: S8 family serine peptidase [Cryobacterium sp.]
MSESTAALPSLVFAHVSPRSIGGTSLFDEHARVTAETVPAFTSESAVTFDAAQTLAEAGFQVLQQSPTTINIAGPPYLFESFFSTHLSTRQVPTLKPGQRAGTSTFIDSADNDTPGLLNTARSPYANLFEGAALEKARYPMQLATPPRVPYWHLDVPADVARLTRADTVHRTGLRATGVRLVMVDSGWVAHPWFAAHGFSGRVLLAPGATDAALDTNGHGTGESANAFAVAPGIDFTMVKMNFANSTAAFTAAAQLNPAPQVISCSWGSDARTGPLDPIDQALAAAIALAVSNGMIVVVAAGNGHFGFPGQHPDVISAGGVFVAANGARQASDYASGFASPVYPGRSVPDVSGLVGLRPGARYIMLPQPAGSDIDANGSGGSFPTGDETSSSDGWAVFSGTSAATPQLAGACALLCEAEPGIAPATARELLMETAEDVTQGTASPITGGEPAGPGHDRATGAGLVDVFHAVVGVQDRLRPAASQTVAAGQPACARVVYRAASGHLIELYSLGDGWAHADLTAVTGSPPAVGTPASYQSTLDDQGPCARVVYRGLDGHIHELANLGIGSEWVHGDLTAISHGPLAAGTPFGFETRLAGQGRRARVLYRGVDGHVHELSYGGPHGWEHVDLHAHSGAPLAAGSPVGYQTGFAGEGDRARVVYRGVDAHVHEFASGESATDPARTETVHTDLTGAAQAPLAAGAPVALFSRHVGDAPRARVFYRGRDGHLHQLARGGGVDTGAPGALWRHSDLTEGTGAPLANGSPAAAESVLAGQRAHVRVVFRGVDAHVRSLSTDGTPRAGGDDGERWFHDDLTAATESPEAAGTPAIYQSTLPGQGACARIVYRSAHGRLQELRYLGAGTRWASTDLTGLAAAPLFGEDLSFMPPPAAASPDTD